jgi:ABC-type transport system involved in multi-copper enzyme maturation permease subunit
MHRTFVILRHTFWDSVAAPIYSLLLLLGAATLAVFGFLPFFTLGEDTLMFKSVGLDVILLILLLAMLFTTSKSIFEEIEDRTMLTLMSKPLHRWEVMVGKYLGIIAAMFLADAALGGVLIVGTWLRIPGDYMLHPNSVNQDELMQILDYRKMHLAGLIPSLLLAWLQISVLAAIGVALSTRVSLVVNLPTVILIYIAGNLTRFLFPLATGPLAGRPGAQGFAWFISLVLPYLEIFDIRQIAILGVVRVPGTRFFQDAQGVSMEVLWTYVGIAVVYAIAYAAFALGAGMWLFQNRELGGGEG